MCIRDREVRPEGGDLRQGVGVVEHGEVEVDLHGPVPLQLGEPRLDLPDSGWVEARPQENTGQGVHVVPEGHTAMEGRLQQLSLIHI